ncbi:unnamed protein product [Rodentolepis nana]|uniref:Cystatin domain-containing protein n=1 Tax=Rodentolepis nana TaxID=102285 RepID=A0A0R3TJL4_RODNA|nr:unnamed protein product [Rodentolepis nana]
MSNTCCQTTFIASQSGMALSKRPVDGGVDEEYASANVCCLNKHNEGEDVVTVSASYKTVENTVELQESVGSVQYRIQQAACIGAYKEAKCILISPSNASEFENSMATQNELIRQQDQQQQQQELGHQWLVHRQSGVTLSSLLIARCMASMPWYEVKDSGGQLDGGGWMERQEKIRGSALRVSALMVEGTDKEECLLLTCWEWLLWLRICRSWCYASAADID